MNKEIFIFDGAMGTYFNYLLKSYKSSELCNISHANLIQDIHQQYVKAGAKAIKTNTFGLNTNLIDQANRDKLIKAAIFNATKFQDQVEVFANIGPINNLDQENEYIELVDVFLKEGLTNFLFETLLDFEDVKEAIIHLKAKQPNSYVIVSFAVDQDGYTQSGNYYQTLLKEAAQYADCVGLNCIIGPNNMEKLVDKLGKHDYNLSIMPNAGYIKDYNDDFLLRQNISYFSDIMARLAGKEVNIIGGCCYTTPQHIKELVNKSHLINPVEKNDLHQLFNKVNPKSKIKELFDQKQKVIIAEVEPPNSCDTAYLEQSLEDFKNAGVHLISLVDSPLARTRADSMLLAAKLTSEQVGVVPHLTCRDRNQIALKSALIGANIFGVNNVLALSGDAVAKIDRDYTKGVYDFNSFNLINFINELNHDIFTENPFYIGAALNINATNFDVELKRALTKLEKGANYFISQSVFSNDAIANLKKAKEVLKVPIIANIYPVASYKNALFLDNEVKGIDIPQELIIELEQADKNDYQKISVNHCCKIIDQIYDIVDGFTISTPIKKSNYALDLIKYLKEKEVNKYATQS